MTELEFFSGMKKLSNYYLKEITNDQITAWYDMFQKVDYDIFEKAITEISTENNYMPTAGMLYEKCSLVNKSKLCNLIQYMYEDGYFHKGFERLTDEQASRNLDKTLSWIEKGIVPEFLIKDMESYLHKYNQEKLNGEERLQIKG